MAKDATSRTKPPPTTHFHLATDRWTEPFWSAAAERRLEMPRCGECKRFRMPPAPFCAHCQSAAQEWVEVSGKGAVFSFTLITNPPFPEAADQLPYAPAIIELDDAPGVRLVSAVVDAPIERIAIGARVELTWQRVSDAVTLPRFVLADQPPAAG